MRLEGKVAAITGAARGFGAAAAELFAAEGAKVVIADVIDDRGDDLAKKICANGGEATFKRTDVTSETDVKAMVEHACSTYGGLDVLVANAGIMLPKKVCDFTEADYEAQIGVNVKGVWLSCKWALPVMRDAGKGSIVITSSGGGLRGSRASALYSASKGAVLLLGKSIALETATENIRCNIVCPGPVGTELYLLGGQTPEEYVAAASPMVPMGRTGEPIDVAYAMLYLASDESKFCTGTVLSVDGGLTA